MCFFLRGVDFYFVCISLWLLIKNVIKDIWSLPSYDTCFPLALASDLCLVIPDPTCAWHGGNTVSQDSPRSQSQVTVLSVMDKPAYHSSPFSAFSCPWTPLGFWSKGRVRDNTVHCYSDNLPSGSITFAFAMLEIEPRTLCILGKYSATEPHP